MSSMRKAAVMAVSTLAVIGLAACSEKKESKGTAVSVTLSDYKVVANPATVSAGKTTFTVKNSGTFVHEMLVVKADAVNGGVVLPDGTLDEGKIESSIVDEAADIEPGKTSSVTMDLEAGTYILLCNRMDGTTAHYRQGMYTPLTVT